MDTCKTIYYFFIKNRSKLWKVDGILHWKYNSHHFYGEETYNRKITDILNDRNKTMADVILTKYVNTDNVI